MKLILRLLAREPVMLGAVLMAWVAVVNPSELVLAAASVTVGLVVRWLSTPTVAAKEQAADARVAGGDAREVAVAQYLAAAPPAKPQAAKKAAKR